MSQAATVARLAVRELWMTFRLLMVLVAFVGAGAAVALLPASPVRSIERLALGFGLATVVTASLAAWSLADERVAGRSGWLVTRSVSRGTYLLGWFVALAGVTLLAVGAGSILGWMSVAAAGPALDSGEFVATGAAVVATAWASLAVGLLAGSMARPWVAASATGAVCASIAIFTVAFPEAGSLAPAAAYLLLADLIGPEAVVSDALRAAGIGLTLTAVLLVAARVRMERAEL